MNAHGGHLQLLTPPTSRTALMNVAGCSTDGKRDRLKKIKKILKEAEFL